MESLKLSATIPADKETLFRAWLSSKEHTKFTGGKATCTVKVNGKHTAWNGYISGKNLELVTGKKIVQTWRTTEFAADDEDSILDLSFETKGKSTIIHLYHHNIPKGQAKAYKSGWEKHYFAPMKKYYSILNLKVGQKKA